MAEKKNCLTQGFVLANGEIVDHWPCDVGADGQHEANGSVETIVEYEGKKYLVVCDWENNSRWPNRKANEYRPAED